MYSQCLARDPHLSRHTHTHTQTLLRHTAIHLSLCLTPGFVGGEKGRRDANGEVGKREHRGKEWKEAWSDEGQRERRGSTGGRVRGVKDGGVEIGRGERGVGRHGRRREKVSLVLFSFHYED